MPYEEFKRLSTHDNLSATILATMNMLDFVLEPTKLRNKVPCDCKTCNSKYVEYRTRKSHIELERNLASCVSRFLPGNSDNSSAHVLKVCHSPIAEGSCHPA